MLIIVNIMWYCLIFAAFIFLISGIEEVFFDVYYWLRQLRRRLRKKEYQPLTYEKLINVPEKKIAIIVPCWHESDVIEAMLAHNVRAIDYDNYDIMIGVYPNDPETIAAVERAAKNLLHVRMIINDKPGPTNKSDNLNSIYRHLCEFEQQNNVFYEIIVFHDSEDIIHPLSLKLYNFLIPRVQMIQLPVFPLEVPLRQWTHWIYNDEFAENHTKDIIVREAIKGLVPSAGVGTGFAREAIQWLAEMNNGIPFLTKTLTEDYNTALRIRHKGLRQIFVTQKVRRTIRVKRWRFFGKLIPKVVDEYVATRALFPMEYLKAVRQKARWIMGITMQEWSASGWYGALPVQFTLFHDRKALITHFINVFGYFVFSFWLVYSIWVWYEPDYPTLQEYFNKYPLVWILIIGCTLIMLERFVQKIIAVYRIYGLVPAISSVPRTFYANIMNMHALLRAYRIFFFGAGKATAKRWEKTDHAFPKSSQLRAYRRKVGDLLVKNHLISQEDLVRALSQQMKMGGKIGDVLVQQGAIDQKTLLSVLGHQFNLEIVENAKDRLLGREKLPKLSKRNYQWLIKHELYPIDFTPPDIVTVAIIDPSSDQLNTEAEKKIKPYHVKFVLTNKAT